MIDASEAVRGSGGRFARGGREGAEVEELEEELGAEKKPPSALSSVVLRDDRVDSRRDPPLELIERVDPIFDGGLGALVAEEISSLAPLLSPPGP